MNEWLQWHLDAGTGPKRILALDGGGVRGLVTLGILQRIEDTLKNCCEHPDYFRLAHYFDLIAGTSTGSIIATGLARGMRVAEVKLLYDELCPVAFQERARGIWRAVFDQRPVQQKLKEVLGNDQLQSDKLLTGLMICAKRMDTGSPWILTNNPKSKFWESPDKRYKPNKEFELWRLVRASTAAPLFYEPVKMMINEAGGVYEPQVGVFVDGAVGGFNNPSYQALAVATLPAYGFGWTASPDRMLVISVGTGWWRMRHAVDDFMGLDNWEQAKEAISAMVQDTVLHTIAAMQAISTPRKPWTINTEIGDMRGQRITGADVVSYQRYDAFIEAAQIARLFHYGEPSGAAVKTALDELRKIGNTDQKVLARLFAIGHDAGDVTRPGVDGIELEDFPRSFDPHFFRREA